MAKSASSLSYAVPKDIRRDFAEAHKCRSVGAYNGATLLARRMLESIAKDKECNDKDLYSMLKKMADEKHLDGPLYEWATALREAGNRAAHGDGIATREDVTDLLALAEAIADYVYTFQLRYQQFKRRQAAPPLKPGFPAKPD